MGFLKTIWNEKTLWIVLIAAYLFSRLTFLTKLPIFTDESIYIYWAKLIQTTHAQWFVSITDGKPPLLEWLIATFLTILPADAYLLAGRLPSVMAGFFSMLCMYHLAVLLFASKRAGFLASLFYIVLPFTLFYDRMAIHDSLLTSMVLWSVYFAVKTAKTLSLKYAVLWGGFLGLGFLSKSPAVFYLLLTPLVFLAFTPLSTIKKEWRRIGILLLIVIVLAEGMGNLPRISSAYFLFDRKNQEFQRPLQELLANPIGLTYSNLRAFAESIYYYYTLPLFVTGLLAFVILLWKKPKTAILLLLLWAIPIGIFAAVGRIIFSRYILLTVPYFLLALAFAFDWAFAQKQKVLTLATICILLCILVLPLKSAFFIITDPTRVALPPTDYSQYIADHSSGYGLEEVYQVIDSELAKGNVTIVTQGTFGIYPYAFNLRYWNNPHVTILPRWPLNVQEPQIIEANKASKTLIILKDYTAIPPEMPVTQVIRADKPCGSNHPIFVTTLKQT